jgi:hypothetical protein
MQLMNVGKRAEPLGPLGDPWGMLENWPEEPHEFRGWQVIQGGEIGRHNGAMMRTLVRGGHAQNTSRAASAVVSSPTAPMITLR